MAKASKMWWIYQFFNEIWNGNPSHLNLYSNLESVLLEMFYEISGDIVKPEKFKSLSQWRIFAA